jgi:hypothetical protein
MIGTDTPYMQNEISTTGQRGLHNVVRSGGVDRGARRESDEIGPSFVNFSWVSRR